MSTEQIMLKIR